MSKRCQKENKKRLVHNGSVKKVNSRKHDENASLNSIIGISNVKRWNELKVAYSCKSNEEFVKILLDFAQKHVLGNQVDIEKLCDDHVPKSPKNGYSNTNSLENYENTNAIQNSSLKVEKTKEIPVYNEHENNLVSSYIAENTFFEVDCIEPQKETDTITEEEIVLKLEDIENNKDDSNVNNIINFNVNIEQQPLILKQVKCKKKESLGIKANRKQKSILKNDKNKKKIDVDIRKAPEFNVQIGYKPEENDLSEIDSNIQLDNNELQLTTVVELCNSCGAKHGQNQCLLYAPYYMLHDSITYDNWNLKNRDVIMKNKLIIENSEPLESCMQNYDDVKSTFAFLSLPDELCFEDTNTTHGLGVYSRSTLKEFTQMGPLIGKEIKEVDIPEECNMRDLWEIMVTEKSHVYISTADLFESNWIRFVRPAPSRELRNISAISKDNYLFLITIKAIKTGEELLYWQDDTITSSKKKLEKTSCGGCNMNFAHPIYYRIHCSVFHDIRYSLTIRKYHCKICGAAILGKENIMKHAATLHNGQGAYQCQFCKKFFLRLNYLEMHRTYGCSANPHRSRPLCDFCGRKFCQPQKLKVHIKRMHSDMSEVLKEFQCKNCLKVLGSRAALQRHLKEVHQKQVDGACACSKCGKMFQNKSNLKIHMLTHSGIKPFKCAENNCIAAFTTKQCLQFHYKKVHGLTEDKMPKIERSIDYTFEAYSGLEEFENNIADLKNNDGNDINDMQVQNGKESHSSSDIDDTSMDDRNIDDTLSLNSPEQMESSGNSTTNSNQSPSAAETTYTPNIKMLTKGSKKWIADESLDLLKSDIYQVGKLKQCKPEEGANLQLETEEAQVYDDQKANTNLNTFNRHESSNASLLVEAALDSVCSEPNIDIDVNSSTNCTDSLVNNLYTLSHADALPDVTYSHSVDMNESRDINLISPSVNDHISVTDDLSDELRHTQSIGIDYSGFQQDDFSPSNSPNLQTRNNFVRDYINENVSSPQNQYDPNLSKNVSPAPSPPRYNFGHNINPDHISSDDSNGVGVQNLSIHNTKENIQLDLSIYKSHYNLDTTNFQFRKDFRIKFDTDIDRKLYLVGVDNLAKPYEDAHKFNLSEVTNQNDVDNLRVLNDINQDMKHKDENMESALRSNLSDIRKFDLDLDLRVKPYENVDADLRNRNAYDNSIEIRIKE
ncbi:zinc finger protein [Oryctes borbonicus]|uniref:Zinc finger protein n=1 Tax=Oryctes borbonicus TaxID=1629725 RepID=A0A0T6AU94_9SCAR|nr:zinc finger protein [Oryctes borbonicus]